MWASSQKDQPRICLPSLHIAPQTPTGSQLLYRGEIDLLLPLLFKLCAYVCRRLKGPEEGVGFSGAVVTDDWELSESLTP